MGQRRMLGLCTQVSFHGGMQVSVWVCWCCPYSRCQWELLFISSYSFCMGLHLHGSFGHEQPLTLLVVLICVHKHQALSAGRMGMESSFFSLANVLYSSYVRQFSKCLGLLSSLFTLDLSSLTCSCSKQPAAAITCDKLHYCYLLRGDRETPLEHWQFVIIQSRLCTYLSIFSLAMVICCFVEVAILTFTKDKSRWTNFAVIF